MQPQGHRLQFYCHHLLSKIGEILNDFSNECERARCPVVRILLHEAEEAGGHDGGAQEAEEQGGTDQSLADVWAATVAALLSPRGKNFFELPWEDTEMTGGHTGMVSSRPGCLN